MHSCNISPLFYLARLLENYQSEILQVYCDPIDENLIIVIYILPETNLSMSILLLATWSLINLVYLEYLLITVVITIYILSSQETKYIRTQLHIAIKPRSNIKDHTVDQYHISICSSKSKFSTFIMSLVGCYLPLHNCR